MTESANTYTLDVEEHTQVEFLDDEISQHELEQLNDLNVIEYNTSNYKVEELRIQVDNLREIAYEHSILSRVASSVEVEAMSYFRSVGRHKRVTTGEIAESLDRPTSTISRALGNLVEKGQIRRVQQGIYEYR